MVAVNEKIDPALEKKRFPQFLPSGQKHCAEGERHTKGQHKLSQAGFRCTKRVALMRQLTILQLMNKSFNLNARHSRKPGIVYTLQASWLQTGHPSVCVYIVMLLFLRFSWLSKCLKWCFLSLFVYLPHNLHSWHELIIIKSFKNFSGMSERPRLTVTIGWWSIDLYCLTKSRNPFGLQYPGPLTLTHVSDPVSAKQANVTNQQPTLRKAFVNCTVPQDIFTKSTKT